MPKQKSKGGGPGRRKQQCTRNRCTNCGSWVSASNICGSCDNGPNTSNDNLVTGSTITDVPTFPNVPAYNQVVPFSQLPSHFLSHQLQLALCRQFGINQLKNPYLKSVPGTSLGIPSKFFKVGGAGDCLFRCFSYCISGDISHSLLIRASICSYILTSGSQLTATLPPGTSAVDYIRHSNMENPSSYGTDTEIVAFSKLTNIDVYVYSDYQQNWLRYSSDVSIPPNNMERIYLHHKPSSSGGPCNHFEPVLAMSSAVTLSENDSPAIAQCATDMKATEPIDNTTLLPRTNPDINGCNNSLVSTSPNGQLPPNRNADDCSSSVIEECCKCKRRQSTSYPLKFLKIKTEKAHRRKFGAVLDFSNDEVTACSQCAEYLLNSKGNCWKYAWPSCLYTLLTQIEYTDFDKSEIIKSWFPHSFRQWYGHVVDFCDRSAQVVQPVFRDITQDIASYLEKFERKRFADYTSMLNENPYCDVKCVSGDTTFISHTGAIGFHHFIQYHFPEFNNFNADHELHLASMRSDYLQSYQKLDTYTVMPCLKVDPKHGLVIATCLEHNGGTSKKMIHVPTNPAIGCFCPTNGSQFANYSPCPRTIKTGKMGFNTHSYQLYKASGGFSGISTIQIRNDAKKTTPSPLNDKADSLAAKCRLDFRCQIERKLNEAVISNNLRDALLDNNSIDYSVPSEVERRTHLEHSNNVDFKTALTMKMCSDSRPVVTMNVENDQEIPPTSEHKRSVLMLVQPSLNPFGAQPLRIKKEIAKNDVTWYLTSISQFIPQLWDSLSHSAIQHKEILTVQKYLMKTMPRLFNGIDDNRKKNLRSISLQSTLAQIQKFLDPSSDESSSSNIDPVSFMTSLNSVGSIEVTSRSNITANNFPFRGKVVFVSCTDRKDPGAATLPTRLTDRVSTYELRYISLKTGAIRRSFARYGGHYKQFWDLNNNRCYPRRSSGNVSLILDMVRTDWDLAVYVLIDSPDERLQKYQYLQHMGGQGRFICSSHDIPLTRSVRSLGRCCSSTTENKPCSKSALFTCPLANCTSAICSSHFDKDLLTDCTWQFVEPISSSTFPEPESQLTQNEEELVNDRSPRNGMEQSQTLGPLQSDNDSDEENGDDPFYFATDSGIANTIEEYEEDGCDATDAGAIATSAEIKGVPSHVVLVGDTHVLKRYKHPISVGANNARFLQNMVANYTITNPFSSYF